MTAFDATHHPDAERISALLDGDLPARDQAAVAAHLDACAACAAVRDELRTIVSRAGALPERTPEADLWPGIERRIAAERVVPLPVRPRRVWELSLAQMAAAGILVALLSGGGMWLAISKHPIPPAPGTASSGSPVASTVVPHGVTAMPAGFDAHAYDSAIADLERVLREHRSELDTSTVRIIEQNLHLIDQATAQARTALAADPANPYLNDHLTEQLKRKVDLLRQATAVVAVQGGVLQR